ncbi:MAG: hypothetical protein NC215_05815 [Ruminococcus sp.]|nr:hypothetical protein [Ruminococcus sp.]
MYDKTLSAEQAIKKGTTKLQAESGVTVTDEPVSQVQMPDIPEVPDIITDTSATREIEDLSFAVDDFIRHFSGEPAKPAAPSQPAAPSYPRTPTRPQPQHTPNAQKIQKELQASVITEEGDLSGLMNDYIKIMNDEDDEPKFPRRGSRHKKKSRKKGGIFTEESTPVSNDSEEEVINIEPTVSAPVEEPLPEPTPVTEHQTEPQLSQDNETPDYGDYTPARVVYEEEQPEIVDDSADDENLTAIFDKIDEEDEYEEEKAHSSAGRIAIRTILSIVFVICFIATAAIASLTLVFNVNSGEKALGDYYFFTAAYDYEDVNVASGDLVICKSAPLIDGNSAAYLYQDTVDSPQMVSFGIKNGGIPPEDDGTVSYLIGNRQVNRTDVLGRIYKTVPHAGEIIDIILGHYVIYIAALALLTIILFILITIVLRNKEKESIRAQKKAERKQARLAADKANQEEDLEAVNAAEAEIANEFDSSDSDSFNGDLFSDID